jgi:predicted ATPase/class 3 adenylate cyclase
MGALVSLVMSDIVESTRRWAADEAAMATDLEQHDRVLRAALEGAGGSVCKHTGDGLLAMFDDPAAAVDAAAAIQRAVGAATWRHAEGLRVRVAIHAGLVHRRDNDLFGTAVNRVARLLALCPAGAVLVSGVVAGMLAERALEALALRRVGAVTLTGFATPEEVHALAGPGLTSVETVTSSDTGARGGRLPAVDETLVGRDEEVAAIWEALAQARLATLVGVGGMGKTRLALEIAAGAAESFADGAWWIDLSAATSQDAVLPVAMTAVEAREIPGRTKLQSFTDRFAEAQGLVVFDNCEHVLPAARALVEALRGAAPEMRILATSREALGLRGERILPVGALPAPDATRLFAERARAIRPDLDIAANRETIARLCARLDFIPLAIELAVARCRSMTPSDLEKRLTDRFRLLRGGRAGAERHRTLQAAVAWSHSLLDAEERHVFERMAIFAGGALLDAIAMVAERDEMDTLDILDRLIARSMITATDTKLGMRYGQLETLRQFAEDRLVEAGAIDEIRERHLSWVVALASSLPQARGLEAEAEAFARLGAELDNLRVAIALARDSSRDETVYAIGAGLENMAYLRGDWDLVDQTRPHLLAQVPTEAAIACEVRAGLIDVQRGAGNSGPRFRTHADLPTWFARVSLATRHQLIVIQLLTGGDLRFLGDLVDADRPGSPAEQLRVDTTRLFLAFARQGSEKLCMAEIGEIEEIGRRAVGLARELGTATRLAMALLAFSYAVFQERPTVARPLAGESAAIFDRLGAVYVRDMARRAVILTQLATGVSPEGLCAARDDIALFLSKTQLLLALSTAGAALPAIARNDPGACLRLWAVRRRVIGTDRRRELEAAGLSLPGDVDALMRETADKTLSDAIKDVLAALDRVIADMTSGSPSGDA